MYNLRIEIDEEEDAQVMEFLKTLPHGYKRYMLLTLLRAVVKAAEKNPNFLGNLFQGKVQVISDVEEINHADVRS